MAGRRFSAGRIVAGFAWLLAGPAAADTVNTRYGITLLGLPFGTAAVTGTVDPAGYTLSLTAKLTGLASMVSGAKGTASATGTIPDHHVRPATYATTSANSDITRTTRMSMSNGSVDEAEVSPPWGPFPDRVPVTEADQKNIIDPMSALIMTVPGTEPVIGPAACNRTLPIFDGAARFDIAMSFVGTRNVKTRGYDGPVAVCAVRYRPIAGHRANRAGTRFMADNKQIEAWLAPVGQSRIVAPYRISLATMIGTVVVEANTFEVTPAPVQAKAVR